MLRVASPLRDRHVFHHPGTEPLLLHDDRSVALGDRALVPLDREVVEVRGGLLSHHGVPGILQPLVTAASVRGLLHTNTDLLTTAKLQLGPLPFPVDEVGTNRRLRHLPDCHSIESDDHLRERVIRIEVRTHELALQSFECLAGCRD